MNETIDTPIEAKECFSNNPLEITSRKTIIAAVSLGEAIIQELIGKEISNIPSENREGLMAAIINNELKL